MLCIFFRNTATELVDQELLFVGNEHGKLLAFRDIVKKGISPPVLVFVQSKERAQQLFSELIYDGINVDAIHADRTQLQVSFLNQISKIIINCLKNILNKTILFLDVNVYKKLFQNIKTDFFGF